MTTANPVGLERVAAALHALAERTNADRLERIMAFLCLLLEEAAQRPRLLSRVTAGTLVVELRRSRGTAELVLAADDGRAFTELIGCELPFVSFESITRFVAERSADFGRAFVLIVDDVVSVSVLAEVDLEDASTTVHADLFEDVFEHETTLTPRWDVDATVVRPPAAALLERLTQLELQAGARGRSI